MPLTFAVHQPNYMPWLGYFHKIGSVDVFVFLDNVQYPRGRSPANRTQIKTPNGVQWLTVPVSTPKGHQGLAGYLDVTLGDERWKSRHSKALQMNYGKSPYFHPHYEHIVAILERHRSLVPLNIALIRYFCEQLGITTPLHRLTELPAIEGSKSQLIAEIGRHLGADIYLSGEGARKYNDERVYRQYGIRLTYQHFVCPKYPQRFGEFVPNLSIVDLLFNCGPESGAILMSEAE